MKICVRVENNQCIPSLDNGKRKITKWTPKYVSFHWRGRRWILDVAKIDNLKKQEGNGSNNERLYHCRE